MPKPSDICSNGATIGTTTCTGESACPATYPGSSTWTKYSLFPTCYYNVALDRYAWLYNYNSAVFSTADKCVLSDPASYLRSGQCDGSIGGIYKTCCNNSGGGMSSQACVQIQPYSGAPYPPYDGVCPSGSYSVTCGYSGAQMPTCGPSACGATPTPTPILCSNGDPCDPGQVGTTTCTGPGDLKTCYNFGGTYCWAYSGSTGTGACCSGTRNVCISGTTCTLP